MQICHHKDFFLAGIAIGIFICMIITLFEDEIRKWLVRVFWVGGKG